MNCKCEQKATIFTSYDCFLLSIFSLSISRGIQLAGHSAGAHLAICLFNNLVQQSNALMSIVKSLYLISGVYDLREVRFMPTANPNNILSLTDDNALKLSPICFDYDKWTKSNAMTTIHLFIGSNDAPKLIEHSNTLNELLDAHQLKNHRLLVLDGYDHFNIVEDLAKADFTITKAIIDESKLF